MSHYILADDLSGALEAGAAFRACGRRVTLPLAGAGLGEAGGLRVFSTETRNAPAPAVAVARILGQQQAARGRLLFKKIDSTLRGPVGAELRTLGEILAPPLVVVCPATPAAGRTVVGGVLRVRGVNVAETEFRRDPGWPVKEGRVETVLATAGVGALGFLPLAELRAGTIAPARARGVLVSDAETDDDLRRLVAWARAAEPGVIFVGAGGLAHAVAAADTGADPAPAPGAPASVLFVSGSLRGESRRQMEVLRDTGGVPLAETGPAARPEKIAEALSRALHERGVAALAVAPDCGPVAAHEPVAWLGAALSELLRRGPAPQALVVTGGETARLLCTLAGVTELELIREFEPGVVLAATGAPQASTPRCVVIKPGGFGSEGIWLKVLQGLRPE